MLGLEGQGRWDRASIKLAGNQLSKLQTALFSPFRRLEILEIDHLNKNPVYAEFRQNLQRRKIARSHLIFGVRGCPDMHMKAEIGKFDDM